MRNVITLVLSCSVWWVLMVLAVPIFFSSLLVNYLAARGLSEHSLAQRQATDLEP